MRVPSVSLFPGAEYCAQPEALVPGHRLDLLVDGRQAYPAMLEAISGAVQEIHLETYIFGNDNVGRQFADALAERAKQGVTVRVIFDAIGSFGLSESVVGRMRAAGVSLAVFHPVAPWRRRWGWSVRDHRKLLIVDGRTAFAGGLNIGDEYAPREAGGGDWHDIHVEVSGPAVRDLQKLFARAWRYAHDGNGPMPRLAAKTPSIVGPTRIEVLGIDSRRGRHQIRRRYFFAMKRARERIRIQAAYFIAERGLRRVLRNAVLRGVTVEIMVPHRSDVPAVLYASKAYYGALLKAGVRLYEWLPSMLHAKTVVVDQTWCAAGSYNLDHRSLLYNWELALDFVDPQLGTKLDELFERDLEHCKEIRLEEWSQRGLGQRILEQIFYRFRRWL